MNDARRFVLADVPSEVFDSSPAAPVAARRPAPRLWHGRTLEDDHAWLACENWRDVLRDPAALPKDIAALLKAENGYCERALAPLAKFRKTLAAEMRARIKEDDSDPAFPDGSFAYYERTREGGEHFLSCRTPRASGAEEILLDGDALAADHDFFEIGDVEHAPDHAQLAWSVDDNGSELYVIRTRPIGGADRDDIVEDTDGSVVWSADAKSFFYVRIDDNHRSSRVFRHHVGADPESDELVIEEADPAWFVSLDQSRCGRFGVVSFHGHDASECWLVDLRDKAAPPRLVTPREPRLRYEAEPHGDEIFILENADGADDFRISVARLDSPGRANWRAIVPHLAGRMIVGMSLFSGHLVWMERENSLPRIMVRDLAASEQHAIGFEEEAYALAIEDGYEFDTATLRFSYSSPTTPEEIYDYDMQTRARVLLKREEIPSGHDPKNYVARRLYAVAEDGETVPVTLLHRADFAPGAGAPVLLYGYGAYGYAASAGFDSEILSLVDRGFVYATAHVRGGTDKGWAWYESGKLENKPNTFSDFIACARHLEAAGYAAKGAIVAQGASAGGLLMGAVVNMAPELFCGVIAGVPFVDVLNTILRADLPLTPPEWLEWGNPIEDAQAFARIASYSPYDNVTAQDYPPILVTGGLSDPRVTYWEPLKWVQKLRATMRGGGPVLLKMQMGAGHAGASGRFERLEEVALEYAFALACAKRVANTA